MNPEHPAEPAMYARGSGDTLDLLFLQCRACGALSFPANAYGCHRCGAAREQGETVRRPGVCTLRNRVTVHQNLAPAIAAPYVVGELELAPGIVEEAVLAIDDEAAASPGMTMRAVAMPDPNNPGQFVCRFVPAGAPPSHAAAAATPSLEGRQ